MANYVLEITLQSPLTPASGQGRVGITDRDVVYDDLGLPILPGRRLKGLWREAYRDVTDALELCGDSPIPAKDIFGRAGKSLHKGGARLQVANAELQEALSLKEWLNYLQHPNRRRRLQPDDVVQHFAAVRAQTAMNRESGAVRENTLRFTRTLRSGLVFRTRVMFVDPPDDAVIEALSLSARAIQYMGTERTRGLGKVSCRFILDPLPPIITAHPAQSIQNSTEQTTTETASALKIPSHVLRYRLTLKSPVVIQVADSDPNTVVTRQDIPGSYIWGAAAWHYLRPPKHSSADEVFRHAFLEGGLRFLTAYPESCEYNVQQRLIPIPHSIRRFKENYLLVDLNKTTFDALRDNPVVRLDRRYAKLRTIFLETQAVKTERNYHHTRAKDRRKGRALDSDGAIFRYEAIQANQNFQGAVLGSESDLKNLQTWLQDMNTISIGRSRSAQYGEVEFEWFEDAPQKLCEVASEWDGFSNPQLSPYEIEITPPLLDNCLIITTLSPLLSVNNYGHPDACFPKRELVKVLKLNAWEPTLLSSYTRLEIIGGYHTHLRLPRQQRPAIAAGSVFVFDIKDVKECITEENLLKLEHEGLGLRKGEGFGRIAVNRQDSLRLTGREEILLDDPKKRLDLGISDTGMPAEIQDLLQDVIRKRCLAAMREHATRIANQIPTDKIPSNSLLGRLRLFSQHDAPVVSLEALREPAEEKLKDIEISLYGCDMPDPYELTLYQLFERAWTEPQSLTRNVIAKHVSELVVNHYPNTHQMLVEMLADKVSETMCEVFLDYLLTVLYRKSPT